MNYLIIPDNVSFVRLCEPLYDTRYRLELNDRAFVEGGAELLGLFYEITQAIDGVRISRYCAINPAVVESLYQRKTGEDGVLRLQGDFRFHIPASRVTEIAETIADAHPRVFGGGEL